MAKRLANIWCSELDRVNCPFYLKVGVCRHGDRCSRHHLKPVISPALLLSNMYQRPDMITPGVNMHGQPIDPKKIQEHFENFYEDLFEELNKYGEIRSLYVCLADHMLYHLSNYSATFSLQFFIGTNGNFSAGWQCICPVDEDEAANALKNLTGRYYSGRPIIVEFSPVTDFKEATCRQYKEETCNRGGYCNFMHRMRVSRELRRRLFGRYPRSRSRSPERRRSYETRSHGSRSHSRRYDDDRDYHDSQSSSRANGRSRSPAERRPGSLIRAGSEERRAVYEQWNREREEAENASKAEGRNVDDSHGHELPSQTLYGH